MVEVLTNWGDETLLNTIYILEGRKFSQELDGYHPYPPGIYFSDDLIFMRSMVNHYDSIRYKILCDLKNITIDDFWRYLEKRHGGEGELRKALQRDYLIQYSKKFKKYGKNKLLSLVSDKNIKRVHFIHKGMYLFGIMPEYFVKFV